MKYSLFFLSFIISQTLFSQQNQKKIAITIDDLPFVQEISLEKTQADTKKILDILNRYKIKSCGFVNEGKVNRINEIEPRTELLENWMKAGQELGNHTYSHISFNQNSLEDVKKDFLNGEIITEKLMKKYGQKQKYYRYPYLQTGNDSLKKYGFMEFLKQNNYINAPVTIDTKDYMFSKVYTDAFKKGDTLLMKKTVGAFLEYSSLMIDYYEKLTQKLENKQSIQIYLCHANMLNADNFDKFFDLLKSKGYVFVDLKEALQDKIYQREEKYVGNGGFSWLHRWRMTDKIEFKETEPKISQEILQLYEGK